MRKRTKKREKNTWVSLEKKREKNKSKLVDNK